MEISRFTRAARRLGGKTTRRELNEFAGIESVAKSWREEVSTELSVPLKGRIDIKTNEKLDMQISIPALNCLHLFTYTLYFFLNNKFYVL